MHSDKQNIMKLVNDFFHKLTTDIRQVYFPNENHGQTQNKKYHATTYAIESFNNGCLTIDKLISKLSINCTDTDKNIRKIVNKYVTIECNRNPTAHEIKLGHGATHYRDFTISEIGTNKKGEIKKRFKSKDDNLFYSI